MTARTGRRLVDFAIRVEDCDDTDLRVAMGYLIGASAHSIAVRRALAGALDAADTAARQAVENTAADPFPPFT